MKYAIIFLFCIPFVSAMHINEIMFNPEGADIQEFIEIAGANNLTDFFIGDTASNDSLILLQYTESNYSLIVTDTFNYSNLNCSIYSAESSIGNHLNNDQDVISIYQGNASNATLIDTASYNGSAAKEGHSLELINETWQESLSLGGSPCTPNIAFSNTTPINTTNETNTTNSTEMNTTACNATLSLTTDKDIYNNKEQISFYNVLNTTSKDYVIEYWIEDLFGNIIKSKINTTNTNKKTYTPSIDEKDKVLVIKNRLASNCSDNQVNSSKTIIVLNPGYTENVCPICPSCPACATAKSSKTECPICKEQVSSKKDPMITSFYTRSTKTNQTINLYMNAEVNTGYQLAIYSIKKKQNIENNAKNFSVFVPEGKSIFMLAVESNGTIIEAKTLEIGEEAIEEKEEKITEINSTPKTASRPSNSSLITAQVVYESPMGKVKNYLNYGLVIVIVLGIIVFLWSKYYGKKAKDQRERENRAGLGYGQGHFRDGRFPQRAHCKDPEGVYKSHASKPRHYRSQRRKLGTTVPQGGQDLEHVYGDGTAR